MKILLTCRPRGFTLVELLVSIAIIGILIMLMLPAVSASRESARQSFCANNLAGLSQALTDYELATGHFPPGVVNPQGPIFNLPEGLHHNWIFQVLPMLDERPVAERIDPEISVYDPQHDLVREISLSQLVCPSDRAIPGLLRQSNYVGIHHDVEAPIGADNHGILFLNSKIYRDDIQDGSAHTLLLSEKRNLPGGDLGWLSGTRATLRNTGTSINRIDETKILFFSTDGLPSDAQPLDQTQVDSRKAYVGGLSSDHAIGPNTAFADGHVQLLDAQIDAATLQQLGHRMDHGLLDFEKYR